MKKLTLMAALALFGAAVAQDRPQPGPRHPMGMGMGMNPIVAMVSNPRMAEKLGLTEEQKTKIAETAKANREAASALQGKLRTANEKQFSLLKAEKIDEASVMAAIDEVFDVRKELAKLQTKRVIAIKAILTPEQVAKAQEEMKNFRRPPHDAPRGEGKPPRHGKGKHGGNAPAPEKAPEA